MPENNFREQFHAKASHCQVIDVKWSLKKGLLAVPPSWCDHAGAPGHEEKLQKEVKALPVQGLEEKCSQETVPKGRVRLAVTGCHVWVDTHLFIHIHKISLLLPLLLSKYSKYSQNIPTTATAFAKPTYVLSFGWFLTTMIQQETNI